MTAKNIFPNLKVTHIFLREKSIAPVIVQFQSLLEDNNISLKFQALPLISSKPHEIMKKTLILMYHASGAKITTFYIAG